MKRHTQEYILDHLECEGQMDISDFPEFCPSNVDNSVSNVDNNSRIINQGFDHREYYKCDICPTFECVGCKLG